MILTDKGARIVTVAMPLEPNEPVAVIVTTEGLPVGTAAGAVKVVVPPLAVCRGEKEPQGGGGALGALEQATDQVTPPFAGSFLTTAVTGAVAPVNIVLGTSAILIVIGMVTVDKAEALNLWSAVANAVKVMVESTILGIWIGEGTKNVVLPPGSE